MIVYHEDRFDSGTPSMFEKAGVEVTRVYEDADTIMFGGGADVSPILYGDRCSARSFCDGVRDDFCIDLYNRAVADGKFLTGICRGSQFLNVMAGGRMAQDCPGHGRIHWCSWNGSLIEVASTHHQIMMPSDTVLVEGVSTHKLCTAGYYLNGDDWRDSLPKGEVEVISADNMLAVQFHPEYMPERDEGRRLFIKTLKERVSLWHNELTHNPHGKRLTAFQESDLKIG